MKRHTNLTAEERRLHASIAGLTGWANTADRTGRARHASRGNWQKFFNQTDPNWPDDARAKAADSLYAAHMKRLTFKSMKARRERKEAREREAQARREARQAETLDGGAA